MEDLKSYLISKVLLLESDTLPSETDKALQLIRRDKTDNPLIYISSGTSGIIGSHITPPLAPPKGRSMSAHL